VVVLASRRCICHSSHARQPRAPFRDSRLTKQWYGVQGCSWLESRRSPFKCECMRQCVHMWTVRRPIRHQMGVYCTLCGLLLAAAHRKGADGVVICGQDVGGWLFPFDVGVDSSCVLYLLWHGRWLAQQSNACGASPRPMSLRRCFCDSNSAPLRALCVSQQTQSTHVQVCCVTAAKLQFTNSRHSFLQCPAAGRATFTVLRPAL
jgi:hypothetical protein